MKPSPVPPSQGILTTNRIPQSNASHGNQDRAEPNTELRDMDSRPKLEATRTDGVTLDASRHVTVSAETRARWELLRALAGVQKSEDPQTPKPEASVKNPAQVSGPHPYEIIAAQVLQASTAPPANQAGYETAAAGIGRRNASHGRRPQLPGAASPNQAQGSSGSYRLRPLMLPRMVSRSNSGRKTGSSGHVPIVHPSTVSERHSDRTPSLPRQQEASRPSHQQHLSGQSGNQGLKPLQPSSQMLPGPALGYFATSQVPSASPRPSTAYVPPTSSAQCNNVVSSAIGGIRHGNQLPTAQYPQGQPQIVGTKVEPDTNISADASNKHASQRATLSAHLPNSPGTSATPATPIADKSPGEVLVLLANGDPDVLAFIYTDEGVEWLLNSKYLRSLLSVSDFYPC
jgi:hypothetical protein